MDDTEEPTAEEQQELDLMGKEIMESLKDRFGEPLPRLMHMTCGWGGSELWLPKVWRGISRVLR
jgi:hypothetical protein